MHGLRSAACCMYDHRVTIIAATIIVVIIAEDHRNRSINKY